MTHLLSLLPKVISNRKYRYILCQCMLMLFTLPIAVLCGTPPALAQGLPNRIDDSINPESFLSRSNNQINVGHMQQCSFASPGDSSLSTDGSRDSDTTIINGADSSFSNCYVNAISISLQILGVVFAGPILIRGLKQLAAGSNDAMKKVMLGSVGMAAVFYTPGWINWLFACMSQ